MKPEICAVLGYSCHLTPLVRRYLDSVCRDLKTTPPETVLFFSGGFTMDATAPGVSEARMMADYLGAHIDREHVLDEQARTTLENLRNLARTCRDRGIAASSVVICCDRVRRKKIAHVARRLLGGPPQLWCYDLERSPLHSAVQQTLGLAFDALAVRLAPIEWAGNLVIKARNTRR
jgi:hypothetical protein